ncbi:hypothetical protein GQ600_16853 [Phytophthora cactorum]|nr:hypothetical protein GQ600_16853 [Phytophthora cactorum]
MWIEQQPDIMSDDFRIYLDSACANGHVEVLEWVIQHYPTKCFVQHADTQAASAGRLAIVATSL